MGQFLGVCTLTPLDSDEGRNWREDTDFGYRTNNGDTIETFAGNTTDLASIPRPLWVFWPPEGLYTEPAVIHDGGYREQKLTRLRCDQILLEAMQDKGVDWFTCHVIYAGVRIGGWVAWGKYAGQNKGTT